MDTDWSLLLGRTCLESTMQTGAGGMVGVPTCSPGSQQEKAKGRKSRRSEPGLGGTLLLPVWLSLLQ